MTSRVRMLAPIASAVVLLASCGGEDLAENLVEDRIEDELGSDGDVDLDLGDGEFSIKTDEGELVIKTDEDGNIVVHGEGDDGEINIESENGRTVIEGPDGTSVIEADEDGNVRVEGPDGEIHVESEDGRTVLAGPDGTTVVDEGGVDLPDDFPSDVPLPDDMTLTFVSTGGEAGSWLLGGTVAGPAGDALDAYLAVLTDAGFTATLSTVSDEGGFVAVDDGTWAINAAAGDDGDSAGLTITVTPSEGG